MIIKKYYSSWALKIRHSPALRHYLVIVLGCSMTMVAIAHPGELDSQGGHVNRKTSVYHCHSETCVHQHRQSLQALEEARQENHAYSKLYERDDWPHWSDLDNDCQDTRAEILIASSKVKVRHSSGNRCYKVLDGEWLDLYTNKTFYNAWRLDIDHRIALAEAHRYGGAGWSTAQKEAFANDPLNLIAVQADANRAKGSHPAHQWMPKDVNYWCEYIRVREQVAAKYALRFPEKELQFNARIKQQFCH